MQQNNFFQNLRTSFPSEREAQLNRLRIPVEYNIGGGKYLDTDDIEYIVDNTYQQNSDGTSYGVGKDGRPYSYRLNGASVSDINSLDMEIQRDLIRRFTNGEIDTSSSIASPENLAWIFRAAKMMSDYGNGNFRPRNVKVYDMNSLEHQPSDSILGLYFDTDTPKEQSGIFIRDTNNPELEDYLDYRDAERGWSSSYGNGAAVTTHELSHAADYESYRILDPTIEGDKDNIAFYDYNQVFEKAAERAGFDSVNDAMASVSEYGADDMVETVAEAYTDVLFNGNNAKAFSKELIKILSDQADARSRLAGERSKKAEKLIGRVQDSLPMGTYLPTDQNRFDRFRRNWKLAK